MLTWPVFWKVPQLSAKLRGKLVARGDRSECGGFRRMPVAAPRRFERKNPLILLVYPIKVRHCDVLLVPFVNTAGWTEVDGKSLGRWKWMRRLHPPLGHDEACGLSTVDCHCLAPRCRNSKWRVLLRLQENDGNCSEKKKKGSTIKRQLHSITCPEQNSPNTLQPLKHQPTNLNVQEKTSEKEQPIKQVNR